MTAPGPVEPFRWQDGERVIVFGRGRLADALELLGEGGFALLTSARGLALAPELAAAADSVHQVPAGRVDELATEMRPAVRARRLVALGGGRVIDVAKALAAADPPRSVAAIPTTLSGAEMTAVHRHAAGVPAQTPRVRPALVLNDPVLSASQPPAQLAASAANALGHSAEGPLTPLRHPLARAAALEGARLLAVGFGAEAAPGSPAIGDALALGALLAGYVIGTTGYGLHHVVSQTLARFTTVGHGVANAIMLPWTLGALRRRFPARLADLDEALGEQAEAFATRLAERTGVPRLRDGAVSEQQLERCAEQAGARQELALTPPAADRAELRALYRAAY